MGPKLIECVKVWQRWRERHDDEVGALSLDATHDLQDIVAAALTEARREAYERCREACEIMLIIDADLAAIERARREGERAGLERADDVLTNGIASLRERAKSTSEIAASGGATLCADSLEGWRNAVRMLMTEGK